MKRTFALVVLLLLLPVTGFASSFTMLAVFGDSLSDQGNASALTGGTFPPPPYAQRASNGPVAAEVLAGALGVPLAPSTSGGSNYAVVGATTGPVTIPMSGGLTTDNFAAIAYGLPVLLGTGILNQVGAYVLSGPVIDPDNSLFMVWGGPNDFFIDPSAATAANAVTNLAAAISGLYGAGARQFLVPNMPDLSLTPFGLSLSPVERAGLQGLSIGFNAGLGSALDALKGLPDIVITPFDTFSFLTTVSSNPSAFGFTNVTAPCFTGALGGGGTVCADPDSYLFWDSVHPTAAGHRLLGAAFADAAAPVPEPSTLVLMGSALAGLFGARRRRNGRGSATLRDPLLERRQVGGAD